VGDRRLGHPPVEAGPDPIRQATIAAGERHIDVVTRRNALQAKVLTAFGADTSAWDRARIS